MLNTVRSHASGFLAKVLLALLVFSFAVWGIGDMVHHPGHSQTVATVGGAAISFDEFSHNYRREMDNVHRALGANYSPELAASLHIENRVVQRLVQQKLLTLETESLGLIPGDAEVVRRIRSNPSFQDSKGNFDKELFQAFLRNSNLSEKAYVDRLRQDIATGLILGTLTAGTPLPDIAISTMYRALEEERSAALYRLPPALINDLPQPTDAEIEAFYKAHADAFTAPEYRTLSYVSLTQADAHAGAIPEAELNAAYKERLDEFKKPERRVVEQLLFSSEEKAKKTYAELEGGAQFAAVAKTADILNKNSVSLGEVEPNKIIESAEDAVFALPQGGFTPPIQSPFGWHIFHVSGIKAPSVASFEEARPMLEKDMAQRHADEAMSKLANKFEDALAGGGSLQETAGELGLKVQTLGPVNREGKSPSGEAAKNIPAFDKFLDTAFKTEEKNESSMTPAKGGMYYLVRVDSVIPERVRPLAEVRAAALAGWQQVERAKRLEALSQDIAKKFAADATRRAAIEQYHLKAVASGALARDSKKAEGIALPQPLVADIFAGKPGASTGAYPSDEEFLIAVVSDIIPAKPPLGGKPKENFTALAKNLRSATQDEIIEQYMRYLESKYPVKINEAALAAVSK